MHVIYADGIGTAKIKSPSQSILYKTVAQIQLQKPSFTAESVVYPASMMTVGGKQSWNESSRIGVEAISEIMDRNPERSFILLGYSGGCKLVHDWLDKNPHRLDRVAAVGLMSDPFRPQKKQQFGLSETFGWGICGQRVGPLEDRTFWVSAIGDVISDALPDALLRTPADVSDVDPDQVLWDLRHHLTKGNLQLAWKIGLFQRNPLKYLFELGPRLHQARIDIQGYLGGRHTDAYITPYEGGPSLAQRLGSTIVWKIDHPD